MVASIQCMFELGVLSRRGQHVSNISPVPFVSFLSVWLASLGFFALSKRVLFFVSGFCLSRFRHTLAAYVGHISGMECFPEEPRLWLAELILLAILQGLP